MPLFGSIESKHGVSDAPEQSEERYTVNPVGIGLAVLGGVLLVVSVFLPLDEPSSVFERIQENTLIQHEGWMLIVLGATIVLAAASSNPKSIAVCVLSVIAGGLIVYTGLDKSLRTLYPIGSGGEANTTGNGVVVPLGLAIYVAGAGAVLAFAGGLTTFPRRKVVEPGEETQRCPECAETILAAARVCKHCGAHLAERLPPAPA
jgi:hypothetical protein